MKALPSFSSQNTLYIFFVFYLLVNGCKFNIIRTSILKVFELNIILIPCYRNHNNLPILFFYLIQILVCIINNKLFLYLK